MCSFAFKSMPESVENLVRKLLADPRFYPDKSPEERRSIAYAVANKQLGVSSSAPLPLFYAALGGAVRELIAQRYPGVTVAPISFSLPGTQAEYAVAIKRPEPESRNVYASSDVARRVIHFSPKHQSDMAAVEVPLEPSKQGAVQAVKALAHEFIHFAYPVTNEAYVSPMERSLMETTTEIAAMRRLMEFPVKASSVEWAKSLAENVMYRDEFPEAPAIFMVMGRGPAGAERLVDYVLRDAAHGSLRLLLQGLLSRYSAQGESLSELLTKSPDEYGDGTAALSQAILGDAGQIAGGDSLQAILLCSLLSRGGIHD